MGYEAKGAGGAMGMNGKGEPQPSGAGQPPPAPRPGAPRLVARELDWVQHSRSHLVGQVRKVIQLKNAQGVVYKVWISDDQPLEVWEGDQAVLKQRDVN